MRPLFPFEDPRRRCLPADQWPDKDQQAWTAALAPGDILDGTVGAGFHWSAQTREKYRKGYGRWLTFLKTSGRLDAGAEPGSRITPQNVRAYIEELQKMVCSWTLWGRLGELLAAAKVIAPHEDWSWLRNVVRHFESSVKASRNKLPRLRPAWEISAWAFACMDELIADPALPHMQTRYRDALTIGLLIACPTMRLANLAMIEIDRHLIRMLATYRLAFEPAETKTRKPMSIPVPESLVPYLDHYLDTIRPALLDGNESKRLWITKYGKPMSGKALYNSITATTERAFGRAINPHLFRDCAVTTVALEDPEHIGIAAPILGHTDPRATEAHYIQANRIVASRRLRKSIDMLRERHRPLPGRD
ncbi:MAG: site-specific integrase [Rhodospirillaceae bacterium]|jgi:integrase/recombinase XerD|nr:site-specific integrase [Rhodospirillaceae bacterium]